MRLKCRVERTCGSNCGNRPGVCDIIGEPLRSLAFILAQRSLLWDYRQSGCAIVWNSLADKSLVHTTSNLGGYNVGEIHGVGGCYISNCYARNL